MTWGGPRRLWGKYVGSSGVELMGAPRSEPGNPKICALSVLKSCQDSPKIPPKSANPLPSDSQVFPKVPPVPPQIQTKIPPKPFPNLPKSPPKIFPQISQIFPQTRLP